MKKMSWLLVLALTALLMGCGEESGGSGGDGGYSGKTEPATLDEGNSEDLGKGAHFGARQAVAAESEGGIFRAYRPIPTPLEVLIDLSQSDARDFQSRNTTPDLDSLCMSGSASLSQNTSQDGSSGSIEYNFNSCVFDYSAYDGSGSITYDGYMHYEYDSSVPEFMWDYDLSISLSTGESYSLTGSYQCTGGQTLTDCYYTDTYTQGGVSYQVSDIQFTETSDIYSFTAKVYHDDYGYVSIEASNLTQGSCDAGHFDSGTIEVSDSSGDSLTITYDNCDNMTLVYSGNSVQLSQ